MQSLKTSSINHGKSQKKTKLGDGEVEGGLGERVSYAPKEIACRGITVLSLHIAHEKKIKCTTGLK